MCPKPRIDERRMLVRLVQNDYSKLDSRLDFWNHGK